MKRARALVELLGCGAPLLSLFEFAMQAYRHLLRNQKLLLHVDHFHSFATVLVHFVLNKQFFGFKLLVAFLQLA